MLHLLHRLRDPNIGNRVDGGELASVLTDALPPVDERVLTEAAGHFDDLDAIKDQVDRSTSTASALGQFLGSYRGYTRTVLSRRAAAVEQAESGRAKAARGAHQLARSAEEAAAAAEAAELLLGDRRRQRSDREAERRELERSEGYRAHQDLVDRQERVSALDVAARAAESSASRADAAHHRALAGVAAADQDVRRALTAAGEAAAGATGLAADAGLDPALLGPQPVLADDGRLDPLVLAMAEERSRAARTLADGRRDRAVTVRKLALQAEQAEQHAVGAEERAATSEGEADRERERTATARASQAEAQRAWAKAVATWTTTGLAAALDLQWEPVLTQLAGRDGGPTLVAAVRRSVVEIVAPALHRARQAAAEADLAVAGSEEDLAAAEARLAEVGSEPEARPTPARTRDAERDPAAGAAFYDLVEVAPGVADHDAAGLEAALEAAGLLDAWVHADGLVVHPDTRDTLLRADAPPCPDGARTLADVLVAAPGEGSPVGTDTIAAVLGAVGLGEQPGTTAWVSPEGRWSSGVLRGSWRKDHVEFLGAAARRATRRRLLAELRDRVAGRRAALTAARSAAAAAAQHRDAVENLPGTVPPADAIDEAARDLAAAERTLAAARARHDTDRRRAEEARGTANRRAAAVAHEARADALPTVVDELDGVLAALGGLREALVDHRRAVGDVARDHERLLGRTAEESDRRAEAAATAVEAGERRATHASAAHELATLRDALAATVDAVLAQHAHVSSALAELDDSLVPAADRAQRDADKALATAVERLADVRSAEDLAAQALTAAAQSLEEAVVLPGVMLAASGHDVRQLGDLVAVDPVVDGDRARWGVALAAAVAPMVNGDDEVSDGAILSRYDRLSEALAGGYDVGIDAERAVDPSAGYEQHLRGALDYRGWHRFTVKVTDVSRPGSSRTLSNRLGLSQGEQRVLSYLALFAAAASYFDAIARDTPTAPRLLLLDDAFAKVDEPTHGNLLGLLVELDLDFVLTSERMWGCFPSVPSLEIYEAVRDPAHPGVALLHFRWDGQQRHLVGV